MLMSKSITGWKLHMQSGRYSTATIEGYSHPNRRTEDPAPSRKWCQAFGKCRNTPAREHISRQNHTCGEYTEYHQFADMVPVSSSIYADFIESFVFFHINKSTSGIPVQDFPATYKLVFTNFIIFYAIFNFELKKKRKSNTLFFDFGRYISVQ